MHISKKLLTLSGLVLLFAIIGISPVFAGDIPESATQFADYCFIGTVQKTDASFTTVKISEVLFGDYSGDTIDIQNLKYNEGIYKTSNPKKGDYCAIVAVSSTEGYEVYEGLAAKSDSLDRSKLKLKSTNEFVIRMNKYINDGHYSNETVDRIKNRYESRKDSTSNVVTNTPLNTRPIVTAKATDVINSTTVKTGSGLSGNYLYVIIAVICVLLASVFIIISKSVKNNKK